MNSSTSASTVWAPGGIAPSLYSTRSGRIDTSVRSPGRHSKMGVASMTSPSFRRTVQRSPRTSTTVPGSLLFSPMKPATKALSGRS